MALRKLPKDYKIPKFAKLGEKGCGMRYRKFAEDLWRDGGLWGVGLRLDENDVLVSHFWYPSELRRLHRVPINEITYEEWKKSNGEYAIPLKEVNISYYGVKDDESLEMPF